MQQQVQKDVQEATPRDFCSNSMFASRAQDRVEVEYQACIAAIKMNSEES